MVLEGLRSSVAQRSGEEDAAGGRRSRRSGVGPDFELRELHDSVYKAFTQFGSVTYINEHLFLAEGQHSTAVMAMMIVCADAHILHRVPAQTPSSSSSHTSRMHRRPKRKWRKTCADTSGTGGLPSYPEQCSILTGLRRLLFDSSVINTLGPHATKGEPNWSLVKIRYEEPKTLALPVTAGTARRRITDERGWSRLILDGAAQVTNQAGICG